MKGDAAKAFGLTLGAEHAVGGIESHELAVGGRIERGFDRDAMFVTGQFQHQIVAVHPPGVAVAPVDADGACGDPVTGKAQDRIRFRFRVAADQ